jgi:hypothetical protein
VCLAESGHESQRIVRRMLAVAIDDQHVLASGAADAALYGRAVPLVIRMPDHDRPSGTRTLTRTVGRPVVDDNDLVPPSGPAQRRNDAGDGLSFVVCRNDDRNARRVCH